MERRVFLAILLSAAVLIGYQALFPAPSEPPRPRSQRRRRRSPAPRQPVACRSTSRSASDHHRYPNARDIVVENAVVRAVFTTKGATLKSWRLKHFQDAAGQPLDLIPEHLPAGSVHPFAISTDDPSVSASLAAANYTSSADSVSVQGPQTLTFSITTGHSRRRRRSHSFPTSPTSSTRA